MKEIFVKMPPKTNRIYKEGYPSGDITIHGS